jgi:flagellin
MKGVDAETPLQKIWRPWKTEEAKGHAASSKASEKELSPMALGVLNNLSAIYAENNLNNTNDSLQTVLQQLSSGSRINSGADDAAGLSLVNGLAANSAALTQSKTNATEGVGLLQVADGALSQVTSLLNRAITLATEASNGTLNSTQEGAANQEYQSILAEINNIGSTTTYNQQAVFSGNTTAIYTGDSSTTGSSVIELNIRTLSEESVGDSGGMMSYSSGQNNVFLNLSSSTANAATTDALNTLGTTTIDVNYLVKGSNGASTTASTAITVGGVTNYTNTVSGLISAINNSGLGLNATFATQAQAGVTGGGTETGIEISGGLVSAGVDPSSSSTSGLLDASGIPASELLTLGQTVTVKVGTTTVASVTTNAATVNNLQELANQINAGAGVVPPVTGLVTASVITNGDGSQSLAFNNAAGSGALTVTTSGGNATVNPVLAGPTAPNAAVAITTVSGSSTSKLVGPASPAVIVNPTDVITGTVTINGNVYTMGGAAYNNAQPAASGLGTNALTVNGDTYADLARAINLNSTADVTASAGTNGLQLNSTAAIVATSTLSDTTLENPSSTITLGTFASEDDTISGNLAFTAGAATPQSITATQGETVRELIAGINANTATNGVTAQWVSGTNGAGSVLVTSTTVGAPGDITGAASTISDTAATATLTYTATNAYDTGLAGDTTNKVYDSTSGQTSVSLASLTTDQKSGSGIATTSYADGAGEALSGTDLTNQADAKSALGSLNDAITDVAAQDGYIGAEINTLNSISQVMSTQQENVVSAQNAIQATDYASATSDMSKYEILSQTGIAALAQANSVQQEVTKLLQ